MCHYLDFILIKIAFSRGNSKIISTLVDAGCHVNKANIKGRSPLMVCAREGHVEALRALIDGECDLDWQDWDRHTALMLAAEAGHAEIVSALIDAGQWYRSEDELGYKLSYPWHR